MTEYLIDNWLALLSFIIALLGGVPGILSAISHFKNKPKFHYDLANIIMGEIGTDESDIRNSMLLLSGTVANEGPQPLSPKHFELSININGQWKLFDRILIPEGPQFSSDVQDIQISEPWKRDLQKYSGAINRGVPIHGFLMFISKDMSLEEIRELIDSNLHPLKITCIDIYNKKYDFELKPESFKIEDSAIYPKHGVSVSKKITIE